MKIGIIADIHSNICGLESALDNLKDADMILCAGDIVGYYTFVNEVFEEIRKNRIKCILGNHDAYLLDLIPASKNSIIKAPLAYTRKTITKENLAHLKEIEKGSASLEIDGLKIKIYHASPWDEFEEYVYPDYKNFARFQDIDADVIILGHTHCPMVKTIGNKIIINPGSCGQPRDKDYRASFAVFDTKTKEVIIKRTDYDADKVVEAAQKQNFDDTLIQLIKKGER